MSQYRITYTRPYLPAPERFEAQRTVVIAKDEAEVRDIYKNCEITFIEELHPVEAAYEIETSQPVVNDPEWEAYCAEVKETYRDLNEWARGR